MWTTGKCSCFLRSCGSASFGAPRHTICCSGCLNIPITLIDLSAGVMGAVAVISSTMDEGRR